MRDIDTSTLRDDPILALARRMYAEREHGDWDEADLATRRVYITCATREWMR